MRLERLNSDKIKIFLTFDDLQERGITKEDMWTNLPKVQNLFRDMIMEADDELGFQADGPIEVEVFSLPAQGMVVIVSKRFDPDFIDDEEGDDEFIEMQVTLDESNEIIYTFNDFEDVIALSHRLSPLGVKEGALFHFDGSYYLFFEENEITIDLDTFIALLAEFGNPSTVTQYRLMEYGNAIMSEKAIEHIKRYF
ncbi:adapter protein MecA 1/2 [Pullulanibacillus pueri]|uniref:Adapter protein MecA n=1 Tax=Pullulanibacillus pueri TaxID=1437324 RepID=A0A8J2ZUR1_9BACL|nr:genetic competence negative regulator [Pullulanibacillus pueri]MBM7681489.1 adapter protein MecA 1/2 [Pullulanibacillus pueri]GGH79084.1 adapter protein MecA [Pullulanibacillus pueri]